MSVVSEEFGDFRDFVVFERAQGEDWRAG